MKRENLVDIMRTAWMFVRKNGMSMAEGMRCAWRNFKLKAKMLLGIAKFTFVKMDGSIREAVGTLVKDAIKYVPNGNGRPIPPHLMGYWDVEKQGFRCFCRANLIAING